MGVMVNPIANFLYEILLDLLFYDSLSEGPSKTLIGVVTGIAVCMVILIGFVTWWVCKKKKHRMHTEK